MYYKEKPMSHPPAPLRSCDPLAIVTSYHAVEREHEAADDRVIRLARSARTAGTTRPALSLRCLVGSFRSAVRGALVTATPVAPGNQ
jgi:hypothetical protein